MAKSLVEKYEQILTQDPASTVFVEFAKVLLERGDTARAIEVCQTGLSHHADSVVGRVLWGKALIDLGRPAEAMEQFDRAIAIDRDNPHAYNLIGEVLLQKGLYRSALPLLRKAVSLQPNDGRVRQWLEQTQAALAGGPAPILMDLTSVDLPAQDGADDGPPVPSAGSVLESAPFGGLPAEIGDRDETQIGLPAYVPSAAPPRRTTTEEHPVVPTGEYPDEAPTGLYGVAAPTTEMTTDVPLDDEPNPTLQYGSPARNERTSVGESVASSENQILGGMTSMFQALSDAEGDGPISSGGTPLPPGEAAQDPFDVVARRSKSRASEPRGETIPLKVGGADPAEGSVSVSPELYAAAPASDGGLLGDVPEATQGRGARAASAPVAAAPVPRKVQHDTHSAGGGLLGDIPDLPEPRSSLEVPKVEVSSSAAEAIAREYERELREKLAQKKAKKSFVARNWISLTAGGLGFLVLVVAALMYVRTTEVNQGSLKDVLADAKKALLQDTRASYGTALSALERAARMDEDETEIWALTGYANAVLYGEHGRKAEHKAAAEAALSRPGVAEQFPELALATRYHVAEGKAREAIAAEVLAATTDKVEVTELAGRILMQMGEAKQALSRLQQALSDQAQNVRVLVGLGDYYRVSGDFPKALEFYTMAQDISPQHPARILGAAESRLELEQDLSQSARDFLSLQADADSVPDAMQWRWVLAQGRVLAATDESEKAITLLTEGARRFPERGYEFQLALAQALRFAGRMAEAEDAFKIALKARPDSEEAREGLARALLARERYRELLAKIPADPKSRRVSLVRGLAWSRLEEWKRARAEFDRTRVKGRYPTEAIIQLARADAAAGEVARARLALEQTLKATKTARGEVLVALGDLDLSQNDLQRARARYDEAAKEPDDTEGACAAGRFLLRDGDAERALPLLEKAARRNDAHQEAQEALARAYLHLGKLSEALAHLERWRTRSGSAAAERLYALALYQSGRLKEADKAASLAVRKQGTSPEAWRIRSSINFAQGDSKTAFKDLERANKLDPKDSETFCAIAHAFLRAGNTDGARAAFDAAIRENKDSTCGNTGLVFVRLPSGSKASLKGLEKLAEGSTSVSDRAFVAATRARVLLATGQAKPALKAAEEAVKLAPWSAPAQFALAVSLQRLKDAGAKDALVKAVSLDPGNGSFRLALADHLARGNDEDQAKALDEYARFLQIGGDSSDEARVKRTLTSLKRRLASR